MLWWLAIVFLLGADWVPGDQAGFGSRAFSSDIECGARREWAAGYAPCHPIQTEMLAAGSEDSTKPGLHWYEPPNPRGLEVFTSEQLPWMAKDAVGLRYTGPIQRPLADELRKLLLSPPARFSHVVFELDSDGGEWDYVKEVVSVLQEVRTRVELTTRVTEGSLCASGCIPIFIQGEKRKASGSSIWVFHGARSAFLNLPDATATKEYLDLLSSGGMKPGFRDMLELNNRIYLPGSFIFSGHELFDKLDSGIITELFPVWRSEVPSYPSGVGPR